MLMPPPDSTPAPPARDERLRDPVLLRETAHFSVFGGRWEEGGPDCIAWLPRPSSRAAAQRAELRAEALILRLLARVDGVPRLLHLDLGRLTLVETRFVGKLMTVLPAAWLADVPRALRLGIGIAGILADLHAAQVFHADLSPAHIVVDPDSERVGLIEFGRAVAQSHLDLDFVHPAMLDRTLVFGAPEQTGRTGRAVDSRADLYALGAVLYWALTGQAPFAEAEPLAMLHALLARRPESPARLNPAVPPELSALILKLLAKDPDQRYQSAHGVRIDLQDCLDRLQAVRPDRRVFVPGAADERITPAQPSRLFGRGPEIARLTALLDASDRRGRMVLVHGFSGAGKTALLRGLYPALSERGGIFASGRYDEFQRLTPFSALTAALADLAGYWLSESADTLATLRPQLAEALGGNVAALLRIAPSFGPLLAAPAAAGPGALEAPSGNMPHRLRRALIALFDVVRQRGRPVVFFIDNLQWADAASLDLVEAIASQAAAPPLLLVGAYRSNEVDARHPLTALVARVRAGGTRIVEVTAERLGPEACDELVADVLLGPPLRDADRHGVPPFEGTSDGGGGGERRGADPRAALVPLARLLHRRTDGNPFFLLQYLQRLFDAGELRCVQGRWRWDDAAEASLPGSENLVAGLLDALEHLAPETQRVAGGAAALGGAIDVDLLAAAMHQPPERVDTWLLPLRRNNMLLAVRPADEGGASDGGRSGVGPRGGERRLRFCHDRMQQAAYASLSVAERAAWHLAIARAIGRRHVDLPAPQRFAAAHHYAQALDGVVLPVELAEASRLLLGAAGDAADRGAFESALRLVNAAAAATARLGGSAEMRGVNPAAVGLALDLEIARHRAFCGLARHEDADRSFEALTRLSAGDSVAIASAVEHQGDLLAARLRWRETCELMLLHVGRLGIEVPPESQWEAALDADVDAVYAVLGERGAAAFEQLQPIADPGFAAASMLLTVLVTSGIRWRPPLSRWALVRAWRLALDRGRSPDLPAQLAAAGLVLGPLRGDRRTGYALTMAGRRMQSRYADPLRAARCEYAAAIDARYWFEPLEALLDAMRSSYRGMIEGGEMHYAPTLAASIVAMTLETAPQLDATFVELDLAATSSQRLHDAFGPTIYVGPRQFARCMAGLTHAAGSFDDDDFDEAATVAGFGVVRSAGRFAVFRGLAAAIFGDWPMALAQSSTAVAAFGRYTIGYLDLLASWLHALALAQALRAAEPGARAAQRARLDPPLALFAAHALECPANFGHLNELLRAFVAWADDDCRAAARHFEAAIDGAARSRRPYHHAMALENAAGFYAAHGIDVAASAYLGRAITAWARWGATAKVTQLRGMAEPDAAGPDADPLAVEAGPPALDLIGIAEALETMAREFDPEALPALLFDLIRRYAAAERGRLFWHEGADWVERAGFGPERRWAGMLGEPPVRPDGERPVTRTVFAYLTQSLQPLLLPDAPAHARFGRDPEVRALGIQSIVGLTIEHRGRVVGLLYLDNLQTRVALERAQLETLRLICLQFALALDNAQAHRHLETLVARRTEDLERNRAALQAIIDSSPALISMKDPDGRVLLHNRRWAEVFWKSSESFVGRTADTMPPLEADLHERSRRNDRAVFETRHSRTFRTEIDVGGETRIFQAEKFPVIGADGEPFAVGLVSIDVTELNRARHEAEQATRAKSDFLANMSHEIRTPMNAILGMAHLALTATPDPQVQNYVTKIERSAQSLLGVINDILDFSKIEAGKLDMERVDFHLGDVMEHLVNMVGQQAEEKGLELLLSMPPELPMTLVGDPLRLGQVLVNLANNAVKFTEHGEIVVRIDPRDVVDAGEVVLDFSISDTGVGIDEAQRARLFTPFEQADTSTSRRYGGTGLGLAISHHLVELMRGSMSVESVVGEGSTFRFSARFAQPAGAAVDRAAPRGDLGDARLLVVDDNAVARRVLAEMAAALGLRVEQAADGWDALRAVALAAQAADPFDLVLLDWRMPGMDGVECARHLALRDADARPAVLMTTAYDRGELTRRIDALQMRPALPHLVMKPVTPAALHDAAAAALGKRPIEPNRRARRQEALSDRRLQLRGMRMLLVEDNPINQELALELLGNAGLVIDLAENGRQAIDALDRAAALGQHFDAVLMDCQMPVLDGYEATRLLRADPRWRDLPIIAMTANAMTGDRARALEAGMNDHIAKPIDVDAMFETIARWVGRSAPRPGSAG